MDLFPLEMPVDSFCMGRFLKNAEGGKVYVCAKSTPANEMTKAENFLTVYMEEQGENVPVQQPIILNQVGLPIVKGNVVNILCPQEYALAVYDAYGEQQFYFPTVLKIGDTALRSELASDYGAKIVGTKHRGDLQVDLDAIDRRPSGYSKDIQAVLSNGRDVQIAEDISITEAISPVSDFQVIQGVGGLVSNTAQAPAVDINAMNGVKVRDLRTSGVIKNGPTTGGNVAYAVNARDCSDILFSGINTFGYTGSVQLTRVADSVIRDVYSRGNRYHSDVVAGGYGVLLQGCKRALVDGINFEADNAKGDLGRHALYISVVKSDGSFCEDIVARNIIGRYHNIDNRNMWFINIRKSNRVLVDGFMLQGGNGGIALNTDNGAVSQCQLRNGHLQVL